MLGDQKQATERPNLVLVSGCGAISKHAARVGLQFNPDGVIGTQASAGRSRTRNQQRLHVCATRH